MACLCRGKPIHPFSVKGEIWYWMCVLCPRDVILIFLVLHDKDMSFDKQGASDVKDQQRKTSNRFIPESNFVLWSFWGSVIKSATVTKQQVHVFSARHLMPQVVGVFGSSWDVGPHSFNKIYRHRFMGRYREAGAWIKVFPIRMVGASPKAFSASEEIRKFFYTVCLDLILVETGGNVLWVRWEPLSPFPSMWGGVKAAGWSAWWWQSHADLKNCKRQFRGFLWNWSFPSFRPADWVLWGPLAILVIVAITIVATFVVRTVSQGGHSHNYTPGTTKLLGVYWFLRVGIYIFIPWQNEFGGGILVSSWLVYSTIYYGH